MKKYIKYIYNSAIGTLKNYKFQKKSYNNPDLIAADLIRNTHSIEKGLSIKKIRLGFGHQKQQEMIEMIEQLEKYDSEYYEEVIKMAVSALDYYINFHDRKNYNDDFIKKMKKFIRNYEEKIKPNYGGVLEFNSSDLNFNISEIENFFKTRHSIRNFSSTPVDSQLVKKAIMLAQRCPTACNRQGVRTYVIDKKKATFILDRLGGIGGFAEEIDKLIIITAKLSSYRCDEINQYIVSSSIFAAYLSLTLHLYGLGACIIQRPVIWSKQWNSIRKKYNIPSDEQVICMIGVGNLEEKINVPISHRIDIDEFAKFIE